MRFWFCLFAVCTAAFLVTRNFAGTIDGDDPKTPSAKFKIATKKNDDSVEVRIEKDKALFMVKSPSGISQAVIERLEERWPKVVVLRPILPSRNFRFTEIVPGYSTGLSVLVW